MACHVLKVLICLIVLTKAVISETSPGSPIMTDAPTDLPTRPDIPTDSTPTPSEVTEAITTLPHLEHLVCYSCRFASDLTTCRYAKQCPSGSSCLTGKLTNGLYYLDCVPSMACTALPSKIVESGKVTFLNQEFIQFNCCTDLRCNKNIHSVVG